MMKKFFAGVFVITILALSAGCLSNPKRDRFLIPEGYSGEVSVSYSVHGAAPLPMEDGFRLVKVGGTGIFETSSEMRPGKLRDEFYFYKGEARRPFKLPDELGGGGTIETPSRPGVHTFVFSVRTLGPVSYK